jgi:hypothetical protein
MWAKRAGVKAVEIEIRCSAPKEHQRRVEARVSDTPGLTMPTWADVVASTLACRVTPYSRIGCDLWD